MTSATSVPRAVAYFRNGIGNLIQMTPALQALASMSEGGKCDVCLDSTWSDSRQPAVLALLRGMPFVGDIIQFPAESIRTNYRWWFWTEHSEPSDAMRLFESRSKTAMHRRGWDRLFTREVDYYIEGVRGMGYKGAQPRQYCPIAPQPPAGIEGLPRPRIALCNGSFGKMGRVKHWPHFAELSRILRAYYGASVVLVGSGDELRGVCADVDGVGKWSITETASVLASCTLFITVDTGLMHVADALGVPMVTLWGGTLVSKNGPTYAQARIVSAGRACQPCQYTPSFDTCERAECLRELSVGEVMRHVRYFLS